MINQRVSVFPVKNQKVMELSKQWMTILLTTDHKYGTLVFFSVAAWGGGWIFLRAIFFLKNVAVLFYLCVK